MTTCPPVPISRGDFDQHHTGKLVASLARLLGQQLSRWSRLARLDEAERRVVWREWEVVTTRGFDEVIQAHKGSGIAWWLFKIEVGDFAVEDLFRSSALVNGRGPEPPEHQDLAALVRAMLDAIDERRTSGLFHFAPRTWDYIRERCIYDLLPPVLGAPTCAFPGNNYL